MIISEFSSPGIELLNCVIGLETHRYQGVIVAVNFDS